MLNNSSNSAPNYQTPAVNQQNVQLLGNPSLKSYSSPYANSSYNGPSSSFFIPSSIPSANSGGQTPGNNIQQMIQALQGRGQ